MTTTTTIRVGVLRPQAKLEALEIPRKLEEFQRLVEGDIECYVHPELSRVGVDGYANETGRWTKMPLNFWDDQQVRWILGPVVFMGGVNDEGESLSITDEQLDVVSEFIGAGRGWR